MSKSKHNIWIHARWTTKNNSGLIAQEIESKVHNYLRLELIEAGCFVKLVNSTPENVDCLFMMSPKKPLDEIIKMVKGSSSHRINTEDLIPEKFTWEKGYSSRSVSEAEVESVFQELLGGEKNRQSNEAAAVE